MKKKNRILNYSLSILGLLLTFTISCKKDEIKSKSDPIITWENPTDIRFGTLLSVSQLNATSDVTGTFVYTPTIGTMLNVGANQDLKVNFTPSDEINYNTATKTVKINVSAKIDPIITWTNPADIDFKTILSAKQLNAMSDIPGTFLYTPPSGTKLEIGANQVLKVDFTPTDTTNYNSAIKTVKINVTSDIVFNPNKTYGTLTDFEGNVYKTITIGTQTWMAENLRTTKFRNGEDIPQLTYNSAKLITGTYSNNIITSDTIATYGYLYNWFAVSDNRNLAPTGWHVPTDAEWSILINYLGGESVASGKLREQGTSHWYKPNTGANNTSGFTALPGGYCYDDGTFEYMRFNGFWWSSSETDKSNSWNLTISWDNIVGKNNNSKSMQFSVRCLRDN